MSGHCDARGLAKATSTHNPDSRKQGQRIVQGHGADGRYEHLSREHGPEQAN